MTEPYLAIQVIVMPAQTNPHGIIFGIEAGCLAGVAKPGILGGKTTGRNPVNLPRPV